MFLDKDWSSCEWYFNYEDDDTPVCTQFAGQVEGEDVKCATEGEFIGLDGEVYAPDVVKLRMSSVDETFSGNWTVRVIFKNGPDGANDKADFDLVTTKRANVVLYEASNQTQKVEVQRGQPVVSTCEARDGVPMANG